MYEAPAPKPPKGSSPVRRVNRLSLPVGVLPPLCRAGIVVVDETAGRRCGKKGCLADEEELSTPVLCGMRDPEPCGPRTIPSWMRTEDAEADRAAGGR